MGKSAQPAKSKGNVLLIVGVVGILGGIGLLWYGLAPAKDLMDAAAPAFSGGKPPEDLADRLDASMAQLKARALVDGLGFLALMAGVVCAKQAFAKPKPKPVEQLVQEEVERRLAAVAPPAHAASSSLDRSGAGPSAAPVVSGPSGVVRPPTPATAPPGLTLPARPTHCASCNSVLVAGGRICPRGHPQAS